MVEQETDVIDTPEPDVRMLVAAIIYKWSTGSVNEACRMLRSQLKVERNTAYEEGYRDGYFDKQEKVNEGN